MHFSQLKSTPSSFINDMDGSEIDLNNVDWSSVYADFEIAAYNNDNEENEDTEVYNSEVNIVLKGFSGEDLH